MEGTNTNAAIVVRDDDDDDDDYHAPATAPEGETVRAHPSRAAAAAASPLPIHQTNVPRVACAILAAITTGGTTYAFGLYGGALKKRLHLTQGQLDTISAVFFSAGLLSFIPGAMADRFGARNGICVGGVTGAISLMLFWAVAKGKFDSLVPSGGDPALVVAVLSVLNVGIFLSCALITGSVFRIISCQCGAGSKGSAVGVAKGFVGLGSGVYACLFESVRQPGSSELDFLPLCAFFFVTAAAIPSWFGLPSKADEGVFVPDVFTPLHFRVLYASLSVLALLIIGDALLGLSAGDGGGSGGHDETASPNYAMAGILVMVWMAPIASLLFLPQKSDCRQESTRTTVGGRPAGGGGNSDEGGYEQVTLLEGGNGSTDGDDDDDVDSAEYSQNGISLEPITSQQHLVEPNPGDEDTSANEEGGGGVSSSSVPVVGRDMNLFQMLQTPTAWMMLWTGTIIVGGGTVETNNLGQMVESLGFSSAVTPATLALFSVAQSGGRVITGAVSEAALTASTNRCCVRRGVPRPFFFVASSLVAMVAHTILAIATDQVLFVVGITLSGVAFGMVWPLMVLCVGEFFGTAHVGANYMFYDGLTSAAGTFLLSKVVAQKVYEEHIDDAHASGGGSSSSGDDEVTCYGKECFQRTHIVIVLLSATCVVVGLLMQYKTRKVYNK